MPHSTDHNRRTLHLHLRDEAATSQLGAAMARAIQPGIRVYFMGPLGSGKTTTVRALLRALGVRERVKSPSYALVELYTISRLNLYHFDFFRFHDSSEWSDSGFREYFNAGAACLVEWPEMAAPYLPPSDLDVHLTIFNSGREATLTAHSEAGEKCLQEALELRSQDAC